MLRPGQGSSAGTRSTPSAPPSTWGGDRGRSSPKASPGCSPTCVADRKFSSRDRRLLGGGRRRGHLRLQRSLRRLDGGPAVERAGRGAGGGTCMTLERRSDSPFVWGADPHRAVLAQQCVDGKCEVEALPT